MLDKKKVAVIAAVSVASGIAIGFATDLIWRKVREREETCPRKDILAVDDWEEYEEEEWPSNVPDIPKGVNVVDKVVNDQMFVKPDISKMVDYTKYADLANRYTDEKEKADLADIVMPDDEDAPEAFDDARFELIDEAEFVHDVGNENGFVAATGTYFVQDKVLAGWNEDLLEKDISNTVGWRAIAMFDSPDVKAVYVRNLELKVLYEIVRSDDPMEQAVSESILSDIDQVQEE